MRHQSTFPADFWVKPAGGEFVCGTFKDAADKSGPDRSFIANHNAYVQQDVVMLLSKPCKVWVFTRKTANWEPLAVKDGDVSFKLAPGSRELLNVEWEK